MMHRRALIGGAVVAVVIAATLASWWWRRSVENELLALARAELERVGIAASVVSVDGRHATLSGEVRRAAEVERAEEAIRSVPGLSGVTNELTAAGVRAASAAVGAPATEWFEIRFTAGGVAVKGVVREEAGQAALVAAARELVPVGVPVHDRLRVNRAIPAGPAISHMVKVARLLRPFARGAVRVDARSLALEAEVSDDAERRELLRMAAAAAPGLVVEDRLVVAGSGEGAGGGDEIPVQEEGEIQGERHIGRADAQGAVDGILAEEGLAFEAGTAALTASAQQTLDRLAELLLHEPEIRLTVAGYSAESDLAADGHMVLSLRRAEAVVEYLVAQGVASGRLAASGHGLQLSAGHSRADCVEIRAVGSE